MYQDNSKFQSIVTDALMEEYARARMNDSRRQYYARNPEKIIRNRLTSAANLLHKHGLIDDNTHASVLARI